MCPPPVPDGIVHWLLSVTATSTCDGEHRGAAVTTNNFTPDSWLQECRTFCTRVPHDKWLPEQGC